MKVQCVTREDAEIVARLMKQTGVTRPAVVGITYDDVPNRHHHCEWWAVATHEDVKTMDGLIESLTCF